jgi:hypothetical protein
MKARPAPSRASSRSSATPQTLSSTTRPTSSGCSDRGLASALPCPVGRSVHGRGGPERRRRLRLDGTGGSGTRWVHAEPAGGGVQRARAVTSSSGEPQVKPLNPATSWLHLRRRARVRGSPPAAASTSGLLPTRTGSPRTGATLRPSWEPSPPSAEHRRSRRPCHPRAISSGIQRTLTVTRRGPFGWVHLSDLGWGSGPKLHGMQVVSGWAWSACSPPLVAQLGPRSPAGTNGHRRSDSRT